jgi:hypothetical protein
VVGMAFGVFTFMAQEARSDARYRRQALTATVAGAVGCLAIAGLVALVGQTALLIAFLFAVVSPPAVRGYLAGVRRMTGRHRPAPVGGPLHRPRPP